MLRWASELAASEDSARATPGVAALEALSSSPELNDADQKLIDALLATSLAEDTRAYRDAPGAQVVNSSPTRA